MADLGAACLWMGLALAIYACLASAGGQLRGAPALAESGRLAAYALALTLLVATLALVQSFITRDFSLAYVAAHSNLAMPNIYTWVAFYAGNEGSLLYIAFALAALSAVAIRLAPAATRPTLAWTVAILMFIEVFFSGGDGVYGEPVPAAAVSGGGRARDQPAADAFRNVFAPAGADGRAGGDQHTHGVCARGADRGAWGRRVD